MKIPEGKWIILHDKIKRTELLEVVIKLNTFLTSSKISPKFINIELDEKADNTLFCSNSLIYGKVNPKNANFKPIHSDKKLKINFPKLKKIKITV